MNQTASREEKNHGILILYRSFENHESREPLVLARQDSRYHGLHKLA
jgi:hypothetical protein